MADHDQLLKDYLAAALVALQDLDATLWAYLDEGPGERGRAAAVGAKAWAGVSRYYLEHVEPEEQKP